MANMGLWIGLGGVEEPRLECGRIEDLYAEKAWDGTDYDPEDDLLKDLVDADQELETQGIDPKLQRKRKPAADETHSWEQIQAAYAELFRYCQRADEQKVENHWIPSSSVLVMGQDSDPESDAPFFWVHPDAPAARKQRRH